LTAAEGYSLDVHLTRRVHSGLELDVSLALGRECGVVFGSSGAGKTTLLRLIAGLETPDRGHVRLEGETLYDSDASVNRPLRARRIAMVFQDDLLFPHLSVAGNIAFGLKGMERPRAADRLRDVAGLCGVSGLLDRRPETLSGGERQRVGLARALAPRPRLLLCDEPVSALDLSGRHALIERLRAVREAEGIPVLYVTHSPGEAIALGSKLFLIDRGRVLDQGVPLDVLTASRPGSSARLEGVRNVLPAVVESSDSPGSTLLRLIDGPTLVVPRIDQPPGASVVVSVLAEEVLLARGPVEGLSARNVIVGEVVRVLPHGDDAEVLVRTGGLTWIASVVAPAVDALGLQPGVAVHMIIKARSCHVTF
jgi:molybdate transport system ATP-binding protein